MNLYLISQSVNKGYDTYDSAVVCAKSAKEAQRTHPSGSPMYTATKPDIWAWCSPEAVEVELIGKAKKGTKKGVICASFNAG